MIIQGAIGSGLAAQETCAKSSHCKLADEKS